jgi:hypothetical protein
MLSLKQTLHTQARPSAVVAIAGLCGVFSVISFIFAGLLVAQALPLSAGAFLLGGGLEQWGPFAFLIYGTILAGLAVSLWLRWKGSRRAAIVIAGAGVALAVPAMSSAVADGRVFALLREAAQIIVRVVMIFYLSQEPVKEWFANHKLQLANGGRSEDTTRNNNRLDQGR